MNGIRQFVKEEDGLAAAEYVVMLAFIGAALITVVVTFGQAIEGVFTGTSTSLNNVNGS